MCSTLRLVRAMVNRPTDAISQAHRPPAVTQRLCLPAEERSINTYRSGDSVAGWPGRTQPTSRWRPDPCWPISTPPGTLAVANTIVQMGVIFTSNHVLI